MPDHLLITATRTDAGFRVVISTDDTALPIVEFTCGEEDVPALVDAHLVGLLGAKKAA